LALLEEGNKTIGTFLKHVRKSLSRLGTDIAILYQQFEATLDSAGELERFSAVLGQDDAPVVHQWLFPTDEPLVGNLELDLFAMDEVFNPEAERNKAVMVDQMVSNYWARASQMMSVISNPDAPELVKRVMMQAITASSESMKSFLENSDIDDPERFVMALRRTGNERIASVDELVQTLQGMMQQQQAQQQGQQQEAQALANQGGQAQEQAKEAVAAPATPAGLFS
jgi:hypothetical protein